MTGGLDEQLRAVMEMAAEPVEPRPGLADRVRHGVRRRRRRALIAAATSGLVLVAASASFAAVSQHQQAAAGHAHKRQAFRAVVPGDATAYQLAAGQQYLYALSSPPDRLSAYDETTGKLIRQVIVPNYPLALAVGPDSRIWLSFGHDATGGPAEGIWLMSPDLRLRSTARAAVDNLVPTGPTSAQAVTLHGVVEIQMPPPGRPGSGTETPIPGTGIGRGAIVVWWAGKLSGRMVADVNIGGPNNDELDHLVIVGRPAIQFGGSTRYAIQSVASTGNALWAITSRYGRSGPPSGWGPLIRLDSDLHVTTPRSIRVSATLARATHVWTVGSTVWVASALPGHWLACFTAAGEPGAIISVPVDGQISGLAVSADTVYFSVIRSHGPGFVQSHPVPAACR